MANHRLARIVVPGLLLVAAGIGGYLLWRLAPEPQIVGVVRATEVRVAPEVGVNSRRSSCKKACKCAPATWSPNCQPMS